MGKYLNPADMPKEQWLLTHGELIGPEPPETRTKDGSTAAVLVHNGLFTAAGLCFDEREFNDHKHEKDIRPKLWFWVPDNLTGAFK